MLATLLAMKIYFVELSGSEMEDGGMAASDDAEILR